MIRPLAALLLLAGIQDKPKGLTVRDAIAATKPEAVKWNEHAALVRVEVLPVEQGSVDAVSGRFPGARLVWGAKGEKPGDLDTLTFESFDGGATWKNESKTVRASFGLMPLPEKTTDAKAALEVMRRLGLKSKQPAMLLSVERGAVLWTSTNADEPTCVVHGESGKGLGAVKTTLNELLDPATKPTPWSEAIAGIEAILKDWGAAEWGIVSVDGRAHGSVEPGKALHLNTWNIAVEMKKPSLSYASFLVANGRVSGWNAVPQPTGLETVPAAELNFTKGGGFLGGYPLVADWRKQHARVNVEVNAESDRLRRREIRVRLIDVEKSDQWCQAILEGPTGRVKDFTKQ